jgi:glycosyltransferase involved in cell wall biosynthesis
MRPDVAVSVIMSTHNRAQYLPESLSHLANQDCPVPFEVITIDNASTDNTSAVLQAWCEKDARFRYALESRLGLSCGKNAGIALARAPLLLFTDDDILTNPRWIRSYLDLFARHNDNLMLAGGPYVPIPHDLGGWPKWFDQAAMADIALLHHGDERRLTSFEYVWGGNMAIPRALFERFGNWDETVGRKGDHRGTFEDTEFQDRVRKAGGVVWFCPAAAGRHRVPRETITPRQIASTAFTRGRNDFWKATIPVWREEMRVPKRNAFGGLLSLAGSLSRWAFWVIAFRLSANGEAFERGRLAAFASGRDLDSLRAGRGVTRLSTIVNGLTFRVRQVLLRLCPDVA